MLVRLCKMTRAGRLKVEGEAELGIEPERMDAPNSEKRGGSREAGGNDEADHDANWVEC